MSFLKQPGAYALVYCNPSRVARDSQILAVIRICYGKDEDSIAVAYTDIGEDRRGFQNPYVPVMAEGKLEKVPIVSGQLWKDLVTMANTAMTRVKAEYQKIPAGKVFKVYKNAEGKSTVEQVGGGEGESET